jgi:hypothetical protein
MREEAVGVVCDNGQLPSRPGFLGVEIQPVRLEGLIICSSAGVGGSGGALLLLLLLLLMIGWIEGAWLMLCLEKLGFPPVALRWVRLVLAGTRAGVQYHGYLSPWLV